MKELLEYFKVMVIDDSQRVSTYNYDMVKYGLILDFDPTDNQVKFLEKSAFSNKVNVLFSRDEIKKASMEYKIIKQIVHYITSILDQSSFTITVDDSLTVPFTIIRGVTTKELETLVQNILYSNRPAKNIDDLVKIIKEYSINFDFNKILNNELRIALFNEDKHSFNNGDDAVRYIVFLTTGQTLLIKSESVLDAVRLNASKVSNRFLMIHAEVLSNVFNRHKKIIMSLKNKNNNTFINRISRFSKTNHKPWIEPVAKTFMSDIRKDDYDWNNLSKMSVRDKFKLLNLIAYKRRMNDADIFVIRNGKVWREDEREIYAVSLLTKAETKILESLKKDLTALKRKTIIFSSFVDYGLPISRKQSLGNLPFGSIVDIDGKISSGIYWRNEWGARDLDLSTIDLNGNRTGWGRSSGYNSNNDIKFSGDLVNANPEAMEFMTSSKSSYGLYVNIFSGQEGSKAELIVGQTYDHTWMETPLIREKIQFDSRECVIGFVKDNKYYTFTGRIGNNRANFNGKNLTIEKALYGYAWTVKQLLTALDIPYKTEAEDIDAHNLSYANFTFDKLEELFGI